jgi:hypothetical protein
LFIEDGGRRFVDLNKAALMKDPETIINRAREINNNLTTEDEVRQG